MSATTPETTSMSVQRRTSGQDEEFEEVIEIHWPMDIPRQASFAVYSSQPLNISAPCSMQIHAYTPIRIRSDSKLTVSPAGPATPGFARGWRNLPTELKLEILRYNLLYPSPLWPANINTVIRRELLPYLRMTPDVAEMAKAVFYQENNFTMQFTNSLVFPNSILAKPSMSIRPQLRHITFQTRLCEFDWQILRAMSGKDRAGFTGLIHLKVRYLSGEHAAILELAKYCSPRGPISFDECYLARRGEPVHLPFDGVVMFDRSGFVGSRNPEEDEAQWELTRRVEGFVTRDITFNK